ncbi:Hsp20/alpha crystallin family protein [Halorubellus sp. PRR65]|uniref:Hsp20/alpha crystallin family protein n=1 Tax=Halorubellus sp. PRR65 TaxID=3098148 RepID=UPI002B263AA8|nr:Hsp20/alpha crystallin family protein [Halorubellus sp. PRR65]
MTWNPAGNPYRDDPRFAAQGMPVVHQGMSVPQSAGAATSTASPGVDPGDVGGTHADAGRGAAGGASGVQGPTGGGPEVAMPRADVTETPESYLVELEMPGFEKADISVYADENQLIVAGERDGEEPTQGHRVLQRECPRHLERTIRLPVTIDVEETTATYDAGMCTIEVPKGDAEDRKRIGFQ